MVDFKEKLRSVIKLTDLSEYLKISRPTLYKLINYYVSEDYENISKKVLELFIYIDDTPYITKKQVINYIVQNKIIDVSNSENNSLSSFVNKYECTNSIEEEKEELIRNVITCKNLGSLISLINRYCFLINKDDLTTAEEEDLLLINYIKDLVLKKETLSKDILEEYKSRKEGML